jgi:Mg2+-importing ATPase
MIVIFKAKEPLFQTAWFVESLFTQTLVIFAIRTRMVPFWKSKPSKALILNIAVVLAVAIALPFTFFRKYFKFAPLPPKFLIILVVFIVVYLGLVELVKLWFYRKDRN